jgi:importin subunit alpha-6/7
VEPILATGILPRLVALVTAPEAKIAFEAAWAITNVASTEHTAAVVDAGAVPALVQGMMAADATVRDQCIWCVGNIGGDCVRFRDALYATPGALQALMLNLQNPETPALLANATWALSNFCRGKPSPPLAQAQPLLPALAWLVTQEATSVVSDALWGLSYLTDGPE